MRKANFIILLTLFLNSTKANNNESSTENILLQGENNETSEDAISSVTETTLHSTTADENQLPTASAQPQKDTFPSSAPTPSGVEEVTFSLSQSTNTLSITMIPSESPEVTITTDVPSTSVQTIGEDELQENINSVFPTGVTVNPAVVGQTTVTAKPQKKAVTLFPPFPFLNPLNPNKKYNYNYNPYNFGLYGKFTDFGSSITIG